MNVSIFKLRGSIINFCYWKKLNIITDDWKQVSKLQIAFKA